LARVADVWSHGSVVRGWLIELLAGALKDDPKLNRFTGRIGGGETGEWALKTAKEHKVAVPVIEQSIEARKKSLTNPTLTGKVISALRAGYGGHKEPVFDVIPAKAGIGIRIIDKSTKTDSRSSRE
jgi:6-phosphogluconate dehydrogenase